MNNIKKLLLRVYKKELSLLLVICLTIGLLPNISKAESNTFVDPMADYEFDETNIVTLDVSNGSYIYLYNDSYKQSVDSSSGSTVSHTGNYVITGITGAQVHVYLMSGNAEINLKDLTCNGLAMEVHYDTTMLVDGVVESGYTDITPFGTNFNLVGENNAYLNCILRIAQGAAAKYIPNTVNLSNVKISTIYGLESKLNLNMCSTEVCKGVRVAKSGGTVHLENFKYHLVETPTYDFSLTAPRIIVNNSEFKSEGIVSSLKFDTTYYIGLENNTIEGFIPYYNYNSNMTSNMEIKNTVIHRSIPVGDTSTEIKAVDCVGNNTTYTDCTIIVDSLADSTTASINGEAYSYTHFDHVSYGGSDTAGNTYTYDTSCSNCRMPISDSNGNQVYPTIIKVIGYENSNISLKADNWDDYVKMVTDKNGYIYPWLISGDHTVDIITEDGNKSEVNVTANMKPFKVETKPNVPTTVQTINISETDTKVSYKFDESSPIDGTTSSDGNLEVEVIPGTSKFSLKTRTNPVITYTGDIESNIIGPLVKERPSITDQSTDTICKIDDDITLNVNAVPSDNSNTLEYTWKKDGNELEDASGEDCSIHVDEDSFGTYICTVTENTGVSVESNPIVVSLDSTDSAYRNLLDRVKASLPVSKDKDIIPAINELKSKLSHAEKVRAEMSTEIDNLNKDLGDADKDKDKLQEQYNLLVNESNKLSEDLDAANKRIDELERSVEDLQETINSKDDIITDLTKQLGEANTSISDLTNGLNSLRSLVDSIKLELGVSEDSEIIQAIKDLKRKFNELKGKYDDLVIENGKNSSLVVKLNDRINELEQQISNLQEESESRTTTIKDLRTQIDELTIKINTYETLLDNIKKILDVTNNEEIINKIQKIKDNLVNLQSEYDKLDKEYVDYKTNATNTIEELQLKVTKLESDVANGNSQIEELRIELIDIQTKISDLTELIGQIKLELGVTENTEILPAILTLKNKVTNLEVQVTSLEKMLSIADNTITTLTNEKTEYIKKLDKIKTEVEADTVEDIDTRIKDMKTLIKDYETKIKQLEKDKSDLTDTIVSQRNEIESLKEVINGENKTLLTKISELEEKIRVLESTNIDLISKVDVFKKEIENLVNENTELKKKITELQALLDTANSTIEELRKKVVELTVENTTLEEENKKLVNENENIKKISEDNGDLLKQIDELNKQIDDLKKKQYNPIPTLPTKIPDVSKGEVVLQTMTESKIETVVRQEPSSITAEKGWELSTSPNNSEWKDNLDMSDLSDISGIYTFYTGSNLAHTMETYVSKTVIYAREKSDHANVYACSLELKPSKGYKVPSGFMTSDTKGVEFVHTESNKKTVKTTGKVKFKVKGDYGSVGEGGIYYKVVASTNDFDPDGSWNKVNNNIFTINIDEPVRVYVKYVDKIGNYSVSKTTVLDPTKEGENVPTLLLNKTIYKGNKFKLQLSANDKVIYKSSNRSIATVDRNGVIKAIDNGHAFIECEVLDKNKDILYRYEVGVKVKESKDSTLSLRNLYSVSSNQEPILQSYKLLNQGKTTKLHIKSNKDAKLMYITSNQMVATVDQSGTVRGKKKGTADITIVVYQNNKFYTYLVRVRVSDGTIDKTKNRYLGK